MTNLLEQAIERISKLPEAEQDEIASALLDELESEEGWASRFAQSQDVLAGLADEALAEHRAGRTKLLDPDSL